MSLEQALIAAALVYLAMVLGVMYFDDRDKRR